MQEDKSVKEAIEQGGTYELIKRRLDDTAKAILQKTEQLNASRLEEFGSYSHELVSKLNLHTENLSSAVDMIQVDGKILIGYNVTIGMRSQISIEDIFSFLEIEKNTEGYHAHPLPIKNTFLDNEEFKKAFVNLFSYYKDTKLTQIVNNDTEISIVFQIGKTINDIKIFKWSVSKDNQYTYIGEGVAKEISSYFKNNFNDWKKTDRSNFVMGKHPHISIKDKLFVETIGGDLTIKIENNTNEGKGIYSEPVSNTLQNLEDADISYFDTNDLILLKIKPYQEEEYRYFVYNTITQSVNRLDGIGVSCIELPEDHGFIFSNGYYLKNGDYKVFDIKNNYYFIKQIKSPNGEDFLFVFFDPVNRSYLLYPYNLVTKSINNPIFSNGYALFPSGKLFVIKPSDEVSRVHSLNVWRTSFLSDVKYNEQNKERKNKFLSNIGNSELVRCISDIYTLANLIEKTEASALLYESIIKVSSKIIDDYHFLDSKDAYSIKTELQKINDTAILVINEFEKVETIKKQSEEALSLAKQEQRKIITQIGSLGDKNISLYIDALLLINKQRGHLISLKDRRYIDINSLEALEEELVKEKEKTSNKLIGLMSDPKAFVYYSEEITSIGNGLDSITKIVDLEPKEKQLEKVIEQITLVNDEINNITFNDATVISTILDTVSGIFAQLNQLKARIKNIRKDLSFQESSMEFSAQFKLLSQNMATAISRAETPEQCDEQMARVINQLEDIETKFSSFDDFLVEITKKREEIIEVFENQKQHLIGQRKKKIDSLENAAQVTLKTIQKKVEKFSKIEELNAYFASDTLILKYRQFIDEIKNLGDLIKSDELFGYLKKVKDQSFRQLRDSSSIFEENGTVMKMGKHRFSVNKSPFELSIVKRDNALFTHISSTNFYNPIVQQELYELKDFWDYDVISESKSIYRAEYLAYSIFKLVITGSFKYSIEYLLKSEEKEITKIVSDFSSSLYREGYVKGIHDVDAARILKAVLTIYSSSGSLKYNKASRIKALLSSIGNKDKNTQIMQIIEKYKKAKKISEKIGDYSYQKSTVKELAKLISIDEEAASFLSESLIERAYYSIESKETYEKFVISCGNDLLPTITSYEDVLDCISILSSYFSKEGFTNNSKKLAEEIVYYILLKEQAGLKIEGVNISTTIKIENILGEHSTLENRVLYTDFDDFIQRASFHQEVVIPSYLKVGNIKNTIIEKNKEQLKVEDFKAKPLTSFVRNKLITESYLSLIGDNFAKQMGTLGDKKRTDLMGLLLLISPPGYGKTTIIEYVAQKLGLVFMKINCPSLGHSVKSLDPAEAPDATSRNEIEKINIAFEMGNNVLLYLDDIQHTNPEFLQKFISLCDGSRKVDGVWDGKPKTYDMKGKKFAIVMAGNPYTESGDVFKIPDMLANRADIYNLGDMLSGQREVFELSYIENSLTSNGIISPLANRNIEDLYKFIDMAKGKEHDLGSLEYNYSQAEADEIISFIKKMIKIQKVVLKVNQNYIASSATDDKYRIEPPFKLQGSYRNMNKMTEKLVSIMDDSEIDQLILDHYIGEAQTLTKGTEENMLKLKEILEIQSETEKERWTAIKADFMRNKQMGDSETDGFTKIATQLSLLLETVRKNEVDVEKDIAVIELLNKVKDYIEQREIWHKKNNLKTSDK